MADIANLKIWNEVKQPPSNMLKAIGFGSLKGKSDINPQWRLMAMTQSFGIVGHGWTYRIVNLWSEPAPNDTVMCFAHVAVKTKSDGAWGEEFCGIGGSSLVSKNKNGLQSNDEGYKMAVTDALGVAFKSVGVAADIYFGNYDGSKYQATQSEAFIPKPAYPDEDLNKNIQAWQGLIAEGKASPQAIIVKVMTKNALTDAQKARIMELA